ncbi:MarR family winged helix-turn-helix transcriptional regulator [Kutzneria sp. CA-103260]|uniref:MarR family winged helix-turn-helix transcriptional regulator n=1 Tax=Kutzneria sp. CA-103260 TaxID=2802641 RepID=UPI001BF0E9CA|nr:MarR family transcriptional regulator [Kutzneria sp. CA-103260]QUQ71459.1 MarR family protein [Kutzneria sp. CA-103260]
MTIDHQVSRQQSLQLLISLHRLMRTIRQAAPTGLYPTQLIVLSQLLQNGPMRVGELAVQVPCSQPTATTMVSTLEQMGLVAREPDPSDGRAIQVTLTDLGRDTIISLAHGEAEVIAQRLGELTPEEAAQVLAVQPLLDRLSGLRSADQSVSRFAPQNPTK